MIPAIGPENGALFVLAVFVLAVFVQRHWEATGGNAKATGSGGQSQFLMFFSSGGNVRHRQSHREAIPRIKKFTSWAVAKNVHTPIPNQQEPHSLSLFGE